MRTCRPNTADEVSNVQVHARQQTRATHRNVKEADDDEDAKDLRKGEQALVEVGAGALGAEHRRRQLSQRDLRTKAHKKA